MRCSPLLICYYLYTLRIGNLIVTIYRRLKKLPILNPLKTPNIEFL